MMFPAKLDNNQNETKEESVVEETKEESVVEKVEIEIAKEEVVEEPKEYAVEDAVEECTLGTIIECDREISTDNSERNTSIETISKQNVFWT
jgi:hypothetical protein